MERIKTPIQAIFLNQISPTEKKFILGYLEWKGFRPIPVGNDTNPLELLDRFASPHLDTKAIQPPPAHPYPCLILPPPNRESVQNLSDHGVEILAVGRASSVLKTEWLRWGLGRFSELGDDLPIFPVFFPDYRSASPLVLVYTGVDWMDRILQVFFRSHGIRCLNPWEASHILPMIPRERPDALILNWDRILEVEKNFFRDLEQFQSKSTLPLILGLLDYNKQGFSHDLIRWISKFSETTLPVERLLPHLVYSFLPHPPHPKPTNPRKTLVWETAIRGKLQSIRSDSVWEPTPYRIPDDTLRIWQWFEWFRDEELFVGL